MKSCLRIVLLVFLVTGTLTQELDLNDAFGPDLTPEPKAPEPKKPKVPDVSNTGDLDLSDAFDLDLTPEPKAPEPKKPKVPDVPKTDDKSEKKPSSGGGGLDLEDALGPDAPTEKPAPKPPKGGGGGGSFDDSDLIGVGEGDYKPDGGRSGGRAGDSGQDTQGGADQPEDPDLLWGQILKMLNANMPEEFFMWMSNIRQMLLPLLERVMDLLQVMQ